MNDWRLRRYYGRGAARVLVPMPRVPIETVPLRPGREVLASLSPLYLALLLPLGALLLEINNLVPVTREIPPTIRLMAYEKLERVPEEQSQLPMPLQVVASEPPPRAVSDTPEPVPSLQAIAPVPTGVALADIEMDQFDDMLPLPTAAATRVRVASLARPRPQGISATHFEPVEREAPPPVLAAAAPTSAIALPPVSLPGQNRNPIPVALLEGVPLDSLAACRSRDRENRLKQELMLVVGPGTECTGLGGSYSFLETKNLNAFLLRIARDPGRELGNRCDELMRAQTCVTAQRVAGVLP